MASFILAFVSYSQVAFLIFARYELKKAISTFRNTERRQPNDLWLTPGHGSA